MVHPSTIATIGLCHPVGSFFIAQNREIVRKDAKVIVRGLSSY
jgi:hypothetical protein